MKKSILFLMAAFCWMTASAEAPKRKMLEQWKTWVYVYHHVEDRLGSVYDEPRWEVYYQLDGDTIIDDRQYMKMYRQDVNDRKYYGAFREDEEGCVYQYDYWHDKNDTKLFDPSKYVGIDTPPQTTIIETIKENGQLFRRYRYQGDYLSVEGVGYQHYGIVHALEIPYCPDDYEELAYVSGNDFFFSASGFLAPKEIELTDGEKSLIASNNDFAFNLFRRARGEESSVLSPLSITFALGMLNNGAAGQTQQEINQTLGFGEAGADAINAFCQKMLKESNTLDDKTKSLIANTVFVNEGFGYRLQDDFITKANDYYDAQPQNRDFSDGETMDVINQWASDHTEGMIPKVLNEETFNPAAVSYLLNAIYFKGAWSSPFDVAETKEESFDGGSAVPMMHKSYAEFEYSENDLYQAINLPYGNGAYRMSIFLPREGKSIGDVLETLSGSKWQVNGHFCEIDLKLPRFETDTNQNLVEIMSALGMPTAFRAAYAEFPYFCNRPVYIGTMFQVAKIKLDEEGTEAAAVTVIGMDESAIPSDPVDFHATRPFLYVISEQSTGAIFFIGQYTGSTEGDPNGIIATKTQPKPADGDRLYNLSGQRLSKAPAHGLYIRNGKVVCQ